MHTPREHLREWGLGCSPRKNTHEDQLEQLTFKGWMRDRGDSRARRLRTGLNYTVVEIPW